MSWFKSINWNVVALMWRAMLAADKAAVRLWALVLGLPPVTFIVIWVIYLIQKPWPGGHESDQIKYLFFICLSLISLIAVGFVFLTSTKLDASGPGGFHLGVGAAPRPAEIPPDTIVTTSQTVEKKHVG